MPSHVRLAIMEHWRRIAPSIATDVGGAYDQELRDFMAKYDLTDEVLEYLALLYKSPVGDEAEYEEAADEVEGIHRAKRYR
jgi:hypothetical protein